MNNLVKIVKEKCPNGVEYKEIGTVIDYIQPSKYIVKNTQYNNSYNIPVLTAGQTFILGYTNECDNVFMASKDNPVIIFDDFTTSTQWVDFKFKVKSSAMKILVINEKKKEEINIRYIYHCIKNIKYEAKEHSRQWISNYSKFKIPIPPIEVQNEIVRILDNFTQLTAELTAELTARQRQYEYYRNKLLCFDDGTETLGAVHTHTHTHTHTRVFL